MVQSLNPAALWTLSTAVLRRPSLMIPDYQVATIADIDWSVLRQGNHPHKVCHKAVVFDKDNTLTAPYANQIHESCEASLQSCFTEFEGRVAVLSNSAGTASDDPHGHDAVAFETANQHLFHNNAILPVIRHVHKKPSRKCWQQTLTHFNKNELTDSKSEPPPPALEAAQIIMVGDRLWTDVVFGNLYGCTTVYCSQTLDDTTDNWTAKRIRPIERRISRWWQRRLCQYPQILQPKKQQ